MATVSRELLWIYTGLRKHRIDLAGPCTVNYRCLVGYLLGQDLIFGFGRNCAWLSRLESATCHCGDLLPVAGCDWRSQSVERCVFLCRDV